MPGPPYTTATIAGVSMEVQSQTLTLPTLNTIFVDTGTVQSLSRTKTIYVVVTTPITQTSGQATLQLYASQASFVANGGAATTLTANQVLLGAATNFGASGTTIAAGLYRFSPATTNWSDLQYPDLQIGVEFKFFSAPSAGAMTVYCVSGG